MRKRIKFFNKQTLNRYVKQLAAAQAAQKSTKSASGRASRLAAAQAAQKISNQNQHKAIMLAAAQAAQKDTGGRS